MEELIKNAYVLYCADVKNERGEVEIDDAGERIFIDFYNGKCSDCIVRTYWDNGSKKLEITYKDYRVDGDYLAYKIDGTLAWKAKYKNGAYLKTKLYGDIFSTKENKK